MEKAPTNTTSPEARMSPEHGTEMSAEDQARSEREQLERTGDDPEPDYDEAESNRRFDENLTERLDGTRDFLEGIRDYITTDSMAEAWFELSEAVKGAETVSDRMRKFDAVMEIEQAARELGDLIRAGEGSGGEARELIAA